jgi:hypothetical protein
MNRETLNKISILLRHKDDLQGIMHDTSDYRVHGKIMRVDNSVMVPKRFLNQALLEYQKYLTNELKELGYEE